MYHGPHARTLFLVEDDALRGALVLVGGLADWAGHGLLYQQAIQAVQAQQAAAISASVLTTLPADLENGFWNGE